MSSSPHDSQALNTAAPLDGALHPQASDGTNPASLDKVRDILFGNQMRDVERRFARLEERLIKETADLKDDVRRRLETLEAYVRRENESLEGQIKSERGDRVDAHSGLSNEL